jgi:hypothetical protein
VITVVLITITAMSGVQAEVIAESGDWRVFKSDSSCVMGVGRNAGFALLYFLQSDSYALDMTSSVPWNFPDGDDPGIRILADNRLVFSRDDGAMQDNLIQFTLSGGEAKTLLTTLSNGTRLQLQFPNSDNEGGFISLKGGRATASAFLRCIADSKGKTNADNSPKNAPASTFHFTFEAFRKALDYKIRDDTLDKSDPDFSTTNVCRKPADRYACNFHDSGFQSTVANFKKMDILNGRFTLKLSLAVDTADGEVSSIVLSGDRGDPVNLFQFIGTVENIMQTFDPKIGQEEGQSKKLVDDLGLMRGDSAADIGKPRTIIEPYASVRTHT